MHDETHPPKSLVLIGFMGSGKSTIGRVLHEHLGYPLLDMDQLIEARAGKTIREIFADEGEAHFRDLESRLLEELCAPDAPRRIISTGGGVVVRPENRERLRQLGYVVWLKASTENILQRTARNKARPLLQTEDPRAAIVELLAAREPLYAQCAHLSIDTTGLSSEEVATGVLESARYYFTQGN